MARDERNETDSEVVTVKLWPWPRYAIARCCEMRGKWEGSLFAKYFAKILCQVLRRERFYLCRLTLCHKRGWQNRPSMSSGRDRANGRWAFVRDDLFAKWRIFFLRYAYSHCRTRMREIGSLDQGLTYYISLLVGHHLIVMAWFYLLRLIVCVAARANRGSLESETLWIRDTCYYNNLLVKFALLIKIRRAVWFKMNE